MSLHFKHLLFLPNYWQFISFNTQTDVDLSKKEVSTQLEQKLSWLEIKHPSYIFTQRLFSSLKLGLHSEQKLLLSYLMQFDIVLFMQSFELLNSKSCRHEIHADLASTHYWHPVRQFVETDPTWKTKERNKKTKKRF